MPAADTARLIASLELQDKLSGPAAKADASLTKLEKTTGKLKGSLSNATAGVKGGLLAGIGLGTGLGAFNAAEGAVKDLVGFVGDAITEASDLNETLGKSQIVFGDAASGVKAFGETAAHSMGLSENAAISAAASIGNLLLSTGTAQEKIAPMSEGIVQLASDLSAFNNIPVEDALAKLQSGLVGQERPLRELGVAISAASVDAEALVLGFKKVNGTFTEGEKVQARYALIFKQTATAHGNFALTSDQLAESQRTLNAELEDETAKIGSDLTPAVAGFVHFLTDAIPAVEGFAGSIGDVGKHIGDVVEPLDEFLELIHKGLPSQFQGPPKVVENLGDVQTSMRELAVVSRQATSSVVQDLNRLSSSVPNSGFGMAAFAKQAAADLAGIRDLGKQTDAEFLSGLKSGQSDIDSEWADIINGLKHPEARAKQIAHDLGILTSKSLQTAIQSGQPELSAAARDEVQAVLAELELLKPSSRDIGKKGMAALKDAMNSSNPEIARAARSIFETIQSEINLPKKSYYWGRALADGAALGLGSNASQAGFEAAARRLMAAAISGLGGGGGGTPPPAPPPGSPKPKPKGKGNYNPQTPGNPDAPLSLNVTAIVSSTAISNKQNQSAKFGYYNP